MSISLQSKNESRAWCLPSSPYLGIIQRMTCLIYKFEGMGEPFIYIAWEMRGATLLFIVIAEKLPTK
jgi:hypothetical protein